MLRRVSTPFSPKFAYPLTSQLRTMASYTRLVRFIPKDGSSPTIGEPVNSSQDVGLASYNSEDIEIETFSGSSILNPGSRTGRRVQVGRILSPLAEEEVGTIRCVGLNYVNHAKEVKMAIPTVPTLFMKPATSLADPYPRPTVIPRAFAKDNAADYESEFVIVIGKSAKDVSEAEAMDYVLGYTAANDVSSRAQQFAQSQWCFSKGFDGACPIGPAFVAKSAIPEIKEVTIKGARNGKVCQDSKLDDLIFSVAKIVSFLSQGTTLKPGTIILTGTPAGVGWSCEPKNLLKDGDEFSVYISHGIGTLITKIEEER